MKRGEDEILEKAAEFRQEVEAWIAKHHPQLLSLTDRDSAARGLLDLLCDSSVMIQD